VGKAKERDVGPTLRPSLVMPKAWEGQGYRVKLYFRGIFHLGRKKVERDLFLGGWGCGASVWVVGAARG